MIDISKDLEVFIITNGRGTFPYVLQSVKEQEGVEFDLHIIKDLPWLDANRKILADCKTKFFLRVDDDMILHKNAIHFMWDTIMGQDAHIILRAWMLWEPYSDKRRKGIKVYTRDSARHIGFRTNHLGKIDKQFSKDIEGTPFEIVTDPDLLAIHSCSTAAEHVKYAKMRGEHLYNSESFQKKEAEMTRAIKECELTLEDQHEMSKAILRRKNRKIKSSFFRFISNFD